MRFFFISSLALLLLASCTQEPAKTAVKKDTAVSCDNEPLNPNGDSELALMMRAMAKWTESTKQYVERKEMPTNFPDFSALTTAKSTDSTLDRVTFNVYAANWLMAYSKFKLSAEEDRLANFNRIVNTCAGCHDQFCHGPLKRINKMRIAE